MHDGRIEAGPARAIARPALVRLRPAVAMVDLSPAGRRTLDRGGAAGRRGRGRLLLIGVTLLALAAVIAHQRLHGRNAAPVAPTPIAAPAGPSTATVVGDATFYAGMFDGRPMANGAIFNMDDPTIAAANRWPLGTHLCVRRIDGGPWDATLSPAQRSAYFGRAIEVTVTDHGAFTHALDLSRGAFAELGRLDEGVIHVAITPAPDQSVADGCGITAG